jgi:phospholipid-binding lipoprotein MlaA
LNTPTVMVNDALQGKFLAAANDLGRFVVDSTFGLAGLFDPATPMGLARNEEDFGQTLGHWGLHPGPFVELPILGPSDVRDASGKLVDTYTNPRQYIHNKWIRYGLYLPDFVDRRAALLPLEETLKNVYDPYAFIRDAYLQRRAYLVSDGKETEEPPPDPGADMPADSPDPVAPAGPPSGPSSKAPPSGAAQAAPSSSAPPASPPATPDDDD